MVIGDALTRWMREVRTACQKNRKTVTTAGTPTVKHSYTKGTG
jgi:hypothetical protein